MPNAIKIIDNEKDEFSDFLNLTFIKVYDIYTKIYFNNYEDINIINKEFENSILMLPSSLDEKMRKLVLKYMDSFVELCKYCSGDSNSVSFEWELTPKEISLNDYIR